MGQNNTIIRIQKFIERKDISLQNWFFSTDDVIDDDNIRTIIFPNACVFGIFSYLSIKDLGRVCCVCKEWKYMSEEDWLWENLILKAKQEKKIENMHPKVIGQLSLLNCSAKEKYRKTYSNLFQIEEIFMSICSAYLELEKYNFVGDQVIRGKISATFRDSLEISGVFVYIACLQKFVYKTVDSKQEETVATKTEWYWEIPINKLGDDPIDPSFHLTFKPLSRPKISEQFPLRKYAVKKGTYHWPFTIKVPTYPPTWRFSDNFCRGKILYTCSGMIYGIPKTSKLIKFFTSNRLAESETIPLVFGLNQNQLKIDLGEKISEEPIVTFSTKFKEISENIESRWDFLYEWKPFYIFGENIEIDVEYILPEVLDKAKIISVEVCLVMDVKFTRGTTPYAIKFRKKKYEGTLPAGKFNCHFPVSVHVDPAILELFHGSTPYVYPNLEEGIENNFRILISKYSIEPAPEELSTIVNIPLGVILPKE